MGPDDSATILTARLLGPVSLAIGERLIADAAWPPRGGRALLLLLLAAPGHRLSRDQVLDALWPHLPPGAGRNAYYKAVHSLRRVLEPTLPPRHAGSFVAADGETIALRPGSFRVDVDAFESTLDRAERGAPEARVTLLREAVAWYCGDLLDADPDGGWATDRRERLHRAWQRAVLELAKVDVTNGRPDQALPRLEAVVAADPTNEAAHRLLILAYDAAGQRDLAIRQYERCLAALRDELGVDPSVETVALGAALLDPDVATRPADRPAPRRWQNLPAPPSRLIGREADLDRLLDELWQPETRLMTLCGPGGVGKTRLALELAARFAAELADGAYFVSLASVGEPHLVLPTIARALGVREERGHPLADQVGAVLRDREVLLVLDNFEQVRPAAPVVAELMASCPRLKVLATSREPLHLRAERLALVSPLTVPEQAADASALPPLAVLERTAAVALFVERAVAVAPDFALTEANAAAVARICARVDGLPLAIELAAARCRELPPDRLLERLADRLATLTDGYQDLPPRQQTMRDAIAWSYDLLEPELRTLFRRLAIFAGGCTLDAVQRVLSAQCSVLSEDGADATTKHWALGTEHSVLGSRLSALVEKSLLRWDETNGEPRAVMLETIRDFGLELLEQAGESVAARAALVEYAIELAESAADHLSGPDQASWLDRLETEHANLREALAWTIARSDADRALRLGGCLWRYWWSRGHLSEGRDWLDRALALPPPANPTRRGLALNGAASLAESQGDFVRSAALHEAALAVWEELAEQAGIARALSGLGTAAAHRGDYGTARVHHERSLALARAAGDELGMARTLDRLGTIARHQADYDRAEASYAQSLELFRRAGDRVNVSIVLSNLGEVCQRRGDAARAAELFEEALRLERELDLPDGIAYDLTNLARVRLDLGELDRAAALSAQGIRLFREMGNRIGLADALLVFGAVTRQRGDSARAAGFFAESLRILADLDERSAIPERLEQLAGVALDRGQPDRAVRLFGAAAALRERIDSPLPPADRGGVDRDLDAARALLGDHAFALAQRTGAALPLAGAIAEALAVEAGG